MNYRDVLRENNILHEQSIASHVKLRKRENELAEKFKHLSRELVEQRFVNTRLSKKNVELEVENFELKNMVSKLLEKRGVWRHPAKVSIQLSVPLRAQDPGTRLQASSQVQSSHYSVIENEAASEIPTVSRILEISESQRRNQQKKNKYLKKKMKQ